MNPYSEDEYNEDDFKSYADYLEFIGDYDGLIEEFASFPEVYFGRLAALVGDDEAYLLCFGSPDDSE